MQLMGKNPSYFASTGEGKDAVAGKDTANYPVETVDWYDAADVCTKLNEREKLISFYYRHNDKVSILEGTGYRLPTEAEWEFACRAGTTTQFWISDRAGDLVKAAWFDVNSGSRTHAVGELKSNPFGLFDIHGNVSEWVQDTWESSYFEKFLSQPAIDPAGPLTIIRRDAMCVIRGGLWSAGPSRCRSSDRFSYDTTTHYGHLGFRFALPVNAVKEAMSATPD
jgi:formylglycine-generating enzyme required for sulfatase activity